MSNPRNASRDVKRGGKVFDGAEAEVADLGSAATGADMAAP